MNYTIFLNLLVINLLDTFTTKKMAFNKKETIEWLALTNSIMKDKKLSKKQLDRFEWLKIKGYYYA